jgi:uncharacterized protein
MSVETHVQSLDQKHHFLDQLIAEEEQRPHPDTLKLSELKKEKLRIKDELHRYRS